MNQTELRLNDIGTIVGKPLEASPWLTVTQGMIDQFASLTGDRQWIHIDRERAATQLPTGRTIAHGFLTLSLLGGLIGQVVRVNAARSVNYGLDRVRFVRPVSVDDRIRARFTLSDIRDENEFVQVAWSVRLELEAVVIRPCCSAEWLVLYYR
jgi:acyl dehydratase